MKNQRTGAQVLFLCRAAIIAALYVVVTLLTIGVSSGVIQIRLSEALCILAVFTPAAIPGLFVGCVAANLIMGCALWDVVFGALATLVGALGTYCLRKYPFVSPAPYVAANTVVIPLVLSFVYQSEGTLGFFFVTIGASELISAWGLGIVLYLSLRKYKDRLFK